MAPPDVIPRVMPGSPAATLPALTIHNPVRGWAEHESAWLRTHETTVTAEGLFATAPEALIALPAPPRAFDQGWRAQLTWEFQHGGYDVRRGALAPITVEVDHRGLARLLDGAHRSYAAAAAGLSTVPARVRYLGGAELLATAWQPVTTVARRTGFQGLPDRLVLQWRASDLTLADSAAVAAWPDVSGKNVLSQGTAASRPTFKKSVLNGLPVVRFDGTQTFLDCDPLLTSPSAGHSVYAIVKSSTGGSDVVWNAYIGPQTGETVFWNATAGGTVIFQTETPAQALATNQYIVGGTGTFKTVHVRVPPTGFARGFFNTREIAASAASGVMQSFAWTRLRVGALNGASPSFFLLGDIAELLVFTPVLAEPDRAIVDTYLQQRYALP